MKILRCFCIYPSALFSNKVSRPYEVYSVPDLLKVSGDITASSFKQKYLKKTQS
jgi:hypothetical protein